MDSNISSCGGNKWGMVIAGRGARACDMCGREKARWYCAADEAYLCETCDASVHSANSVARRHERVKLLLGSSRRKFSSSTTTTANTNTSSSSAIGKPSPAAYDVGDRKNNNSSNNNNNNNNNNNKVDVDARNFEEEEEQQHLMMMMDANTFIAAEQQWQLYETHADSKHDDQVIHVDIHHLNGLQQQPIVNLLPPSYDVHVDAQLQVPCSDAINRAHDTAARKTMAQNMKKKKKKKKKKKRKKTAGCANISNSSATSWRSSKKRTPRCISGQPKTALAAAAALPYPDFLVNDDVEGNLLSAANLYGANGVTNHAALLDRANSSSGGGRKSSPSIHVVKQEIPLTHDDDDSISLYDLLGMDDPDDVVCMHDISEQLQDAEAHPHDTKNGQLPISRSCHISTVSSIRRNCSQCSCCCHHQTNCSAAVGATKTKDEFESRCKEEGGGACPKAESEQPQEGGRGGQAHLQDDVHDHSHNMLDDESNTDTKDRAVQVLQGDQSSAAAHNIDIGSNIGSDESSSCGAHCNPSNIVCAERTPDLNLGTHHTRLPNSYTAAEEDDRKPNLILNFDAMECLSSQDHVQPTAAAATERLTPRQLSPACKDKIKGMESSTGGECFHPISLSAIEDDTDDIDTFDVMELCSNGTSFDDDVKCGDDIQLEGRLSGADMDLTWKVGSGYAGAGVDDHDESWSYYADGCCSKKYVLDGAAAAAGSPFKAYGNASTATTSRLVLAAAAASSYPCHQQQLHLELKMEEMDGEEDPYQGVRFMDEGEMGLDVVDNASPAAASAVIKIKLLSLRLDYDDIIHAWCDKGPLWMDGQRPQIVPDISSCCHHLFGRQQHASSFPVQVLPPPHQATRTEREYVSVASTRSSTTTDASPPLPPVVASGHTEATTTGHGLVPVLTVPQLQQLSSSSSSSNSSSLDTTTAASTCGAGGGGAIPAAGGVREARVLRYKEKRRTRLFSKRIRYEVRKLNAERRPRMKGRFVKRSAIAGI